MEYILRQKIYDSLYWKQECFGLSAERIVDKAVDLKFVGGMFGEPQKPTEFICLVVKMLQIQPDKEIVLEFIKNYDFKYLRLLGAFYLRLVGKAVDVFNYLEPLLNDYRRVRVRDASGGFSLNYIDELIDQMLRKDYLFNIALPRLPSRQAMEKIGQLEPRVSVLEDEFNEEVKKEEEEAARVAAAKAAHEDGELEEGGDRRRHPENHREKEKWQLSGGRDRDRDRRGDDKHNGRDSRDHRSRSRSRSRDRYRRRHRSRSRSRSRERDGRRHHSRHEDDYQRRGSKRARDGDDDEGRQQQSGGGGAQESLSIEETNKLRAQLGLAPLKS